MKSIRFAHGQILYHLDERIEHVYFPINSMVSLVTQLSAGTDVEVGVIGSEGIVGLSLLFGVDRSSQECMVQIPDGALQMSAAAAQAEFRRGGALHDLVLRYAHSLMLMTSQIAACNRAHSTGERLARWLLMSYDRTEHAELPLTQEFLSLMLGTRRAGVTEAALILQTEGLISYRRGHIRIRDKAGLEKRACECYAVIKAEFDCLPSR